MRVVAVQGEDDDALGAVLALYRAHKDTLGFMPKGGFISRAEAGTLLAAVEDSGEIVGFVLYDLPGRHVTLRHLCVSRAATGRGVARALVEAVVDRHPERLGIAATCRNDFEASEMWPRLDFEPVVERAGRSHVGHPLTRWWRDFGHPTLFDITAVPNALPGAALDTDVCIDLLHEDARGQDSVHLTATWLSAEVDLFMTKEVPIELAHHPDDEVRSHARTARRVPRRDGVGSSWKAPEARLLAGVPGSAVGTAHDKHDVRHLARAAAAGATYFVTRDRSLISKFRVPAADILDLKVVTPADLIADLAQSSSNAYAPVALEDTTFTLADASHLSVQELVTHFTNSAAAERGRTFEQLLRLCVADREHVTTRIVLDDAGGPVALFAHRQRGELLEVALIRVSGPAKRTIARQIIHMQRQAALTKQAGELRVTDPALQEETRAALEEEGFGPAGGEWVGVSIDRVLTAQELRGGLRDVALAQSIVDEALDGGEWSARLASEIERRCSPLKVIGAAIPTYLVPIRPPFAADLFDSGLSEEMLFGRSPVLGLSREHVYYSGSTARLRTPARILWYVSGKVGEVRATSRLEEVVRDRPLTLHRRFSHLGVWKREEVLRAGGRTGRALAMRFSDTELFAHPVGLDDLTALAEECCHTLVLRSPHEVPERMFVSIYRRGRYGDANPPSSVPIAQADVR